MSARSVWRFVGCALVAASAAPLGAQCLSDQLYASDAQAGARFGWFAVEGSTAVITAPDHGFGLGEDVGQAYVFERLTTGWTEVQKLTASDAAEDLRFGRSVALSGDWLVIGSVPTSPADLPGAAYVFERSGTTWTEVQKLGASDGYDGDMFGEQVDIDGDLLVVSASGGGQAQDPFFAGRVYVFEREATGFVERTTLFAPVPGDSQYFGASLDLDGDELLVGAPADFFSVIKGRAYAFERVGTQWTLQQTLSSPIPDTPPTSLFNWFGHGVSMDGDLAVVSETALPGYLFFYERAPGQPWAPTQAYFQGAFLNGGPNFHHEGERLLLERNGSAELAYWERVSGSWVPRGRFLELPSPYFLSQFAFADGEVLAADRSDDSLASNAGTVFVYDLETLEGSPPSVSLSTGGAQTLSLNGCGGFAGELYIVLGSASGTWPGTSDGTWELPLVLDSYFLFTLFAPGSAILPGSLGLLDGAGEAIATFTLPAGTDPTLAGAVLHHAFVVLDSGNLTPRMASNAVSVELIP